MLVFQYPNCSTCKKALRWLQGQNLEFQSIHIVESPPSADQLEDWIQRSDLPIKRFFNTSGMSYRQGGFKERLPNMSIHEQIAALAADGKLIKRPLVVTDDAILVGFKEAEYEHTLKTG